MLLYSLKTLALKHLSTVTLVIVVLITAPAAYWREQYIAKLKNEIVKLESESGLVCEVPKPVLKLRTMTVEDDE